MNKQRRKELSMVSRGLSNIKDKDDLYSWINTLDNLKDEEQDYYDNIPENLQGGYRADASEEAIDNMDEALDLLNEAYDATESINELQGLINEAIGKINDAAF